MVAIHSGYVLSTLAVSLTVALLATSKQAFAQQDDTEPDTLYYENAPAPAPGACPSGSGNATLTEEVTQGPYYVDELLFRSNVTEDQAGVAFEVRITVLDTSCNPVVGAYVDIWNCNATGTYSAYLAAENNGGNLAPASSGSRKLLQTGTDDSTFLRGTVQTDAHGVAVFQTIIPGWYEGRTPHMHTMVHIPDAEGNDTVEYQNSHSAHTGQFFFEDELLDEVYAVYPYSRHTGDRIALNDDSIFSSGGSDHTQIFTINYVQPGNVSAGLVGSATAIIDPSASHSTTFSMGAGGAGGPMPGSAMGPMLGGAMGPIPSGRMPMTAGRRLLSLQ